MRPPNRAGPHPPLEYFRGELDTPTKARVMPTLMDAGPTSWQRMKSKLTSVPLKVLATCPPRAVVPVHAGAWFGGSVSPQRARFRLRSELRRAIVLPCQERDRPGCRPAWSFSRHGTVNRPVGPYHAGARLPRRCFVRHDQAGRQPLVRFVMNSENAGQHFFRYRTVSP